MKRLQAILLLCLVSIATAWMNVQAQPLLKYVQYKSGGAMDHSRVGCFVQDSKGILWIGTWIGLCRYDGVGFHYFRGGGDGLSESEGHSLGSNRIVKMVLDSRENIWCQNYDYCLYRFDRETSQFQAVLPLIKEYPAEQIQMDKTFVMHQNHSVWTVLLDGTLVRFNDEDPSIYDIIPCLPGQKSRTVYRVYEDQQGREWILTDQGVYIHGKGCISEIPYTHIVEQDGRCFLCASPVESVVEYLEDGQLKPVVFPLSGAKTLAFYASTNGCLYIGLDKGVLEYDPQLDLSRYYERAMGGQLISNVVMFYEDDHHRLWFGADGVGTYYLPSKSGEVSFVPLPKDVTYDLAHFGKTSLFHEDAFGTLWYKQSGYELCWFDEASKSLHSHKECMPNGEPLPMSGFGGYFKDHQKTLWVCSGTQLYHLYFGKKQFQPFFVDSQTEVRSLLVEDSVHVWGGDRSGHIIRCNLEDGSRQYLTASGRWNPSPTVFTEGIYSMLRDSKGRIWIGTRGSGIFLLKESGAGFDVRQFSNHGGDYDLNCNQVYDIYEDEYHHLWVATFGGGINLIEESSGENYRFLHAENDLIGYPIKTFEYVRCIKGDGKGHIMAGTNKGLLAYPSNFDQISNLSFIPYQAQNKMDHPLQDNLVMQVLSDSSGCFYVSTYGRGLARAEGADLQHLSFHPIPNQDYPAGDANLGAILLSAGYVWTVAECGLTCYSPKNDDMWYFDEVDFDRPYALSECAPVEMSDGRVVVGMFGGLLSFYPRELSKSVFPPKIVFTEREYAVGTAKYVQDLNDIDTLIVNPDQRSMSLKFAALDYVPSRLIRYAYWMHRKGDDKPRWVYSATPEINVSNLSPGDYSLHVRSTNSDGVWCDNPRILSILVVPTFWERWAWLIFAILFLLLLSAWLYWHARRMKERQEKAVKQEVAAAKIEMLQKPADPLDSEFIQKLMSILEAHLSDGDLQVNNLADEMNMSRATFYRRLKSSVDISPNDFIHQVRMKRSAEMLVDTDDSISQIAYAVGFNNPKYFSKCFRQDFGVSPAEYRNNARKSAQAPNTVAKS